MWANRLLFCLLFSFINLPCFGISVPPSKPLYSIVWKWLGGKSDSAYYFNTTTHPHLIHNLKDAYQIRRAREFWYDKNLDSFNQGKQNWLAVTGFLGRYQTLKGVYRSGFDMVEQTLGGFTVHVHPIGKDTIEFKVHDIKSRWSLFLHLPFVKNVPFDSNLKTQRNMTDCHWFISWRECVSTAYFYQRHFNKMHFKRRQFTGHHF
ncbi:MAG: hypothetical protein IT245_05315 [Bacteroidia bacterium]|nr:hypothetical protein [Bacteroidia bacterium]